jgi:hypothetical protein
MHATWLIPIVALNLCAPHEVTHAAGSASESQAAGLLERTGAEQDEFQRDAWRERLAHADLERRERAFERLVERAGRDPRAREALEEWARGSDETAWTARLALRELGQRAGGLRELGQRELGQRERELGAGQAEAQDGRAGLQRQREHAARERDEALRFSEEFLRAQGEHERAFEELRERMRELEERMARGVFPRWPELERLELGPGRAQPAPGAHTRSKQYSLQVGPDGARLEVEEDVDGKRETRTYSGESLEEILEANPELRDVVRVPRSDRFGRAWRLLQPLQPVQPVPPVQSDERWERPALPLMPGSPRGLRTDVLGVMVGAPDEDARERAGLAEGEGLAIESVLPGTIADALGIEPGDVLVTINGRVVHGRDDVAAALQERKAGEDVRVEVVGEEGRRRTLTWKEPVRR